MTAARPPLSISGEVEHPAAPTSVELTREPAEATAATIALARLGR